MLRRFKSSPESQFTETLLFKAGISHRVKRIFVWEGRYVSERVWLFRAMLFLYVVKRARIRCDTPSDVMGVGESEPYVIGRLSPVLSLSVTSWQHRLGADSALYLIAISALCSLQERTHLCHALEPHCG